MSDFQNQLLKGEKIVWTGRPAQGVLFTSRDWFLVPFSLFWCGFAFFWEAAVASSPKSPDLMKLFGVPFVLMGLYFVVGRFLVDAWVRRGLRYAVTNKRALISRSAPFANFSAMNLRQAPDIALVPKSDGRGTIRFGPPPSMWAQNNGFAYMTPSLDPTMQFIAIDDARRVYQIIQQAAQDDAG